MKKAAVIILSIVLIVIALAGAAVALASKVNVNLEVTDDGTIYIVVDNPTPFSYKLEEFNAKISMGGFEVASVNLPNPVNVPPGETVRVPANVNIDIGNAFLAALSGSETMDATVYYKVVPKLGPLTLPAHEVSEHETVEG